MRLVLRLLAVLALLIGVGGTALVPRTAAAAGDPDAICDCESGYGACQHFLRAPGITADPCYCDRCRSGNQHGGDTVPAGMSALCFTSGRSECYLKRHSVAWHLACSECAQNDRCCPLPHRENCPDCEDGTTSPLANDDFGKPAKEQVLARLKAEQRFFKKAGNVVVAYNRHFYVVTDIGSVKVKMKGGSFRVFNTHEYAHLMLERAEMARKEFVQVFGDQLKLTRPMGIYLPERERDAANIQATYFGNPRTNLLYGGSDKSSVGDGFCFNGFCESAQKTQPDDQMHVSMRHMIGHELIACWIVVDPDTRALPKWLFEGVGHWLSRLQDRFKDESTWCSQEGTTYTSSGKGWMADCAKMASDSKLEPIERLFGKNAVGTSAGQLGIDDQKRSWSYLDLCLREWREPFVAMLADLRRQVDVRDAFMKNLQCTPEIFDERWKERVTGRRRSMSPKANEDEPAENDTPSARERRRLLAETDLLTLAARVRGLGTVDDPKTVDVILDLLAKNSELVREQVMCALLKMKEPECLERIWNYGLEHKDGMVRAYSARACGKLKLEYAVLKLRGMIGGDTGQKSGSSGSSSSGLDKHWLARAEAAIALGDLKDAASMPAMRKLVNNDPAEKTQLAMMDGLACFGEDAEMSVPVILKQVDSPQWQLRVAACDALGKIGSMEAVDTLVTRMEQESGRVREAIRDALKLITYDDLGMKPENWRRWWDRLKANSPNGIPRRPDKPKALEDGAKKPEKPDPNAQYAAPKYYGIEIYSSRIGFILDTSLSMDQFFEPDPRASSQLSRTYHGSNKLSICKEEIAQTLKTLDPRSHFTIVAFNTRISFFSKRPVPSSPGNISSAEGWLRAIPPSGETDYYDALRIALDLDEGPDESQNFRSTPDTLTFLTDGSPTVGEITDADVLLEWYTSLNRYARIRTHCVCFGNKGVDLVLLRGMAEQNGGRFVIVPEKGN